MCLPASLTSLEEGSPWNTNLAAPVFLGCAAAGESRQHDAGLPHRAFWLAVRLIKAGSRAGIRIAGSFAIACGVGEIIVGFTGDYLGILARPIPPSPAISRHLPPSPATTIVGAFYGIAELCLLTMRKLGAALGMAFLGAEILGRVYLVAAGIAPAHGADAFKILAGGVIAFALILYTGARCKDFQ
jgi:hypothetical protein